MKVLLSLLATVLTLSISYYFAIALPTHNRAMLDFEREKYHAALQEKKAKDEDQQKLQIAADTQELRCAVKVELAYRQVLKSRGTPDGHGGYSLPPTRQANLDKQKAELEAECEQQYERLMKH
jgi:hypothetical protein